MLPWVALPRPSTALRWDVDAAWPF